MKKNQRAAYYWRIIMRITTIQILITILLTGVSWARSSAQEMLNKRISVAIEQADLRVALNQISKTAEVRITFNSKIIPKDHKVTMNSKNERLADILDQLLAPLHVSYIVSNQQIILRKTEPAIPEKSSSAIDNQMTVADRSISGTVTDEKGENLPGVSVVVKGTQKGTITDIEGKYQLDVPEESASLIFSFVGYMAQESVVGNQTTVNIVLKTDTKSLNEVVVVGYGTQKRSEVTGAVASIPVTELKDMPVSSIDQALAGKVPGVQINQASGTPGGGIKINIRGSGSIGAGNDPLYVIDGFPVMNFSDPNNNLLNTIPPDDIKSIEILKDASSTSIYGSRGSNGVVLITTKSGKTGKAQVSFDSYFGIQQVRKESDPHMLNAREWAQYRKEAITDLVRFRDHREPTDADIPEAYRNPEQYGAGTNWFKEITQAAPVQNYNVSVEGGSETIKSRVSMGYFNQDGIIANTGYERFSLSARMNATIGKKVNVGMDIRPTYIRNKYPFSTMYASDLTASPLTPVRRPDGSYTPMAEAPGMISVPNPLYRLEAMDNWSRRFRALFNAFAEYEIVKDLRFKSTINVDFLDSKGETYNPSYIGSQGQAPPVRAQGTYFRSEGLNWLNENTLNYEKTFGANQEHVLKGLVGLTIQKQYDESGNFTGKDYPNDNIKTLNAAATITGTTTKEKWSLLSYLARINYSYKNKYLLTATVRRDGSSRFGSDNRWGNFPSISAGWRLKEESFMKDIPFISELKLRAGYGLAGNFNIGNYTHLSQVGADNYAFGNALAAGQAKSTLGNSNLGWERSQQLDAGLDIEFLSGRIALTADYYRKVTKDMLLTVDIPYTSGFTNATVNLGQLENKGLEFALNTQNITGRFSWSTNLNISFNRNKVLALNKDGAPIYSGRTNEGSFTHISQVGKPLAQFYGFVADGLYTAADIDNPAVGKYSGAIEGSIKYKDLNGDGVVRSQEDFAVIGSPWPNFTYGITNTFNYKKFDLLITASGSQGGQLLQSYSYYLHNIDGVFNVTRDVLNRWRSPEQPGDGKTPTTNGLGTPNVMYRDVNSLIVKDNDYLWIKNITFGYTLPNKAMGKFFSRARVYASIQNAILFTKYDSDNPEVYNDFNNALTPGVDFRNYPVPRTYTIGFNLTF